MAQTKHTPRNPHLNRPISAIRKDVQPAQKDMRKAPVKGGKQPRKHLSHKVLRKEIPQLEELENLIDTDLGMVALREIRHYQRSTDNFIKKTLFQKLIREISQEISNMP